jgi:RimJ/RimL family protein N-acetyltransferase
MAWTLTTDLAAFDAAAGSFIAAEPTRNTLLISVPSALRRRGPHAFAEQTPWFGWFEGADGNLQGAFVHTPPYALLLTSLPDGAAEALVAALSAAGHSVGGLNGPLAEAEAFAAERQAATGRPYTVGSRHRLYVLSTLTPPAPLPPGAARVGTAADRELLVRWYHAFGEELAGVPGNVERIVEERIGHGGLTLWEVDGEPVSMAGSTLPFGDGGIRVAPVYTPKKLRGRGYAGAVTAAVSQAALDAGATEVSLFTDLANPTSNALYQRLGYRPVEDRLVLEFGG